MTMAKMQVMLCDTFWERKLCWRGYRKNLGRKLTKDWDFVYCKFCFDLIAAILHYISCQLIFEEDFKSQKFWPEYKWGRKGFVVSTKITKFVKLWQYNYKGSSLFTFKNVIWRNRGCKFRTQTLSSLTHCYQFLIYILVSESWENI